MNYSILLAAGAALMVISLAVTLLSLRNYRKGEKVLAEVVELHSQQNSDGVATYAPVFQFQDRFSNQIHRHQYWVHQATPTWRVGEKVTIVYHPQNPKRITVVTYLGMFRWALISGCLGLICLVVWGGHALFQKHIMN